MNNRALILGAAAFLIAAPFGLDLNRLSIHPTTAEAAVSVSFDVFFNDLQPHGSWVQTDNYPYVWVPANVGPGWRPYTHGHWIYTDQYGWYFESDEAFAAITYHYGRWAFHSDIGWYWVPGTRWASAWVIWRRDEGHVGWAALPPEGRGYAVDVNIRIGDVPETNWVFVPVEQFLAPQLTVVILAGDQVHDVFARTQMAAPVVQNNVIVNNAIDINFIQQKTQKKVVVHKVEAVGDPKQAAGAPANDTVVRAFVANVEQPKENIRPKQVVDAKAAKAKQDQGGGDTANVGAAAGAGAADAANCKVDASGKTPANCPPAAGQAAGKPAEGQAGEAPNADASKPADEAGKAGAVANEKAAKPTEGAAGQPAVTEAKPTPGAKAAGEAAAKATPKDSGAAAAATESGKAAATEGGKKKPAAPDQASGEAKGKGNKSCTAAQIQAGAGGCEANVGGAAGGAGAVSPDKTGAIGKTGEGASDSGNGAAPAGTKHADEQAASADNKGGGQPKVQTGQPAGDKCTPAMKKANKC